MDINDLRSELRKLGVPGYEITSEKVTRAGIAATKVRVHIHHVPHEHRHLSDILDSINNSSLSAPVKQKSGQIFTRLAEAEAKVHATTVENIHFHEVGAVDSIVDIVGAVIGLELLGISQIMASAVNVGSGTVKTAHGILPIPAPATAEMLRGIPFYESSSVKFELATPTGAAIISTFGTSFGRMPAMNVDRIAYGAGDQDFPGTPNVLRLMIGEPATPWEEDMSVVIETNIDDMNPQLYDYVAEKLMRQGAQDVYFTPITMKKGRPAVLLSVLTDRAGVDSMLDILFRETTSIGVRIQDVHRKKLSREITEVDTRYGKIRLKVSKRGEEVFTVTPEYEDCKKIAESRQLPLKQIIEEAKKTYLASR